VASPPIPQEEIMNGRPGTAVFADTLSVAFALAAVAVVGAVITLAVPGNRTGWLLLAAAATMAADRTQAVLQAREAGRRPQPRADLANGPVTGNAGPCDRP
jgi:hypothetical protein